MILSLHREATKFQNARVNMQRKHIRYATHMLSVFQFILTASWVYLFWDTLDISRTRFVATKEHDMF
jgi:large-conductance mechanosensitive channel